jgi:hypothetical protein
MDSVNFALQSRHEPVRARVGVLCLDFKCTPKDSCAESLVLS